MGVTKKIQRKRKFRETMAAKKAAAADAAAGAAGPASASTAEPAAGPAQEHSAEPVVPVDGETASASAHENPDRSPVRSPSPEPQDPVAPQDPDASLGGPSDAASSGIVYDPTRGFEFTDEDFEELLNSAPVPGYEDLDRGPSPGPQEAKPPSPGVVGPSIAGVAAAALKLADDVPPAGFTAINVTRSEPSQASKDAQDAALRQSRERMAKKAAAISGLAHPIASGSGSGVTRLKELRELQDQAMKDAEFLKSSVEKEDPEDPEDPEFHPEDGDDLNMGDIESPEPEVPESEIEELSPKSRRAAKLAARRRALVKGKGKERASGRGSKGSRRSALCLNCLKSVLAGKMEDGDWCYDTDPVGNRCWKCASGHSCAPIPASVVPFAKRFLHERKKRDQEEAADPAPLTPGSKKGKKADLVGRWRVATKLAIELAEERAAEGHADQPNADLQEMTSAELEAAGRAANVRSWDAMALLARHHFDTEA